MNEKSELPMAVFYARGNVLQEACEMPEAGLPEPGTVVTLPERSLHQRSRDVCTLDCPHCKVAKTAQFIVQAVHILPSPEGDSEPGSFLNRVLDFRRWEENECVRHEWCNLFDWYSLVSYLGWWQSSDGDTDSQAGSEDEVGSGDAVTKVPTEEGRIRGAVVIDILTMPPSPIAVKSS